MLFFFQNKEGGSWNYGLHRQLHQPALGFVIREKRAWSTVQGLGGSYSLAGFLVVLARACYISLDQVYYNCCFLPPADADGFVVSLVTGPLCIY